jgi:hypothetical protein
MKENHTLSELSGEARLCHELRNLTRLTRFRELLAETDEQLAFLDQANNHDEVLSGAMLAAAQGSHPGISSLNLSRAELGQALIRLRGAHRPVVGMYKGEMKDETEVLLARWIREMEALVEHFDTLARNWQQPQRPHDIRRNALSYLIASCSEVEQEFSRTTSSLVGQNSVSIDLINELGECEQELSRLHRRLESLREMCSRKTGDNLADCLRRTDAIIERIAAVELKAGRNSGCWFPDYTARV